MRRIFCIILALTTILSLLTACKSKLKNGEVYDKEFTEAHTVMTIIPVTTSNGKSFSTIMIPYNYYYEDDYAISIKADDGSGEETTYHVSKEV